MSNVRDDLLAAENKAEEDLKKRQRQNEVHQIFNSVWQNVTIPTETIHKTAFLTEQARLVSLANSKFGAELYDQHYLEFQDLYNAKNTDDVKNLIDKYENIVNFYQTNYDNFKSILHLKFVEKKLITGDLCFWDEILAHNIRYKRLSREQSTTLVIAALSSMQHEPHLLPSSPRALVENNNSQALKHIEDGIIHAAIDLQKKRAKEEHRKSLEIQKKIAEEAQLKRESDIQKKMAEAEQRRAEIAMAATPSQTGIPAIIVSPNDDELEDVDREQRALIAAKRASEQVKKEQEEIELEDAETKQKASAEQSISLERERAKQAEIEAQKAREEVNETVRKLIIFRESNIKHNAEKMQQFQGKLLNFAEKIFATIQNVSAWRKDIVGTVFSAEVVMLNEGKKERVKVPKGIKEMLEDLKINPATAKLASHEERVHSAHIFLRDALNIAKKRQNKSSSKRGTTPFYNILIDAEALLDTQRYAAEKEQLLDTLMERLNQLSEAPVEDKKEKSTLSMQRL